MAGILELSDQEFKTAMSNVLRTVMSSEQCGRIDEQSSKNKTEEEDWTKQNRVSKD